MRRVQQLSAHTYQVQGLQQFQENRIEMVNIIVDNIKNIASLLDLLFYVVGCDKFLFLKVDLGTNVLETLTYSHLRQGTYHPIPWKCVLYVESIEIICANCPLLQSPATGKLWDSIRTPSNQDLVVTMKWLLPTFCLTSLLPVVPSSQARHFPIQPVYCSASIQKSGGICLGKLCLRAGNAPGYQCGQWNRDNKLI